MIQIIENSNIVQWDNYPEYICAVVCQTDRDAETTSGHIMPKGEEITFLSDKAPQISGDCFVLSDASINFLGGYYFDGDGDFDITVLEVHFKPKPAIGIKLKEISHV